MFSETIEARVGQTDELDTHLATVSTSAETGVQQLAFLQSSSKQVLESVSQAQEIIEQLQVALQLQREKKNALKRAMKNKRALLIVTESEAVSDLEKMISLLREQSTKLDYELLSCDADIEAANQRLSLTRVGVPAEQSASEDDAVLPESEHAMLEHDTLFRALTHLPLPFEVDHFMMHMASSEGPMSTQRYIRSLSGFGDVQ